MQQNKSSLPTPRRLEQRKWRKRCAATRTLPGNPLLIYWGKQTKQLRKELDDATEQQTVLINKLLSCCHEVRACSYPPRLFSLLNLPLQPDSERTRQFLQSLHGALHKQEPHKQEGGGGGGEKEKANSRRADGS